MRIHFAGKLFFTLCLLTITTCLISAAPSKKAPEFPEGFPEELRKAKFLKKESRILAPGVTYYHYHFDSVLPKGVGPFYRVQYIFTNANGKTAIQRGKALPEAEAKAQDEAARKKIGEAYKELKGSAFVSIAKRYSDAPGAKREKTQITFDTMISEKAEFCSDEIKKAVANGEISARKAYEETMAARREAPRSLDTILQKTPAEIKAERAKVIVKSITEMIKNRLDRERQEYPEITYSQQEKEEINAQVSAKITELILTTISGEDENAE